MFETVTWLEFLIFSLTLASALAFLRITLRVYGLLRIYRRYKVNSGVQDVILMRARVFAFLTVILLGWLGRAIVSMTLPTNPVLVDDDLFWANDAIILLCIVLKIALGYFFNDGIKRIESHREVTGYMLPGSHTVR